MKARTRVALVVAVSLLLAGTVAIVAGAIAYEHSTFNGPVELNNEMLAEIGVTPAQQQAYLRAHPDAVTNFDFDKPLAPDGRSWNDVFREVQRREQRDAINRSRIFAGIAIAILAVLATAVGWLVAGRILVPVRLITRRARTASATDLSGRVALEWPQDELKELADTFDDMLERLQQSFGAQRRFSAQISHELRTPLSVIRNEAELLLSDDSRPTADTSSIESIRAATLRAERLIAALLVLSKTESGNLERAPVAFDDLVAEVVAEVVRDPRWRDRRFDLELQSATVLGDSALLVALATNLVDNAARHNRELGWVRVAVELDAGRAVLRVSNSRAAGTPDRSTTGDTRPPTGVGMTVVQAIVDAHGGSIERHDADDTVTVRVTLAAIPMDDTSLLRRATPGQPHSVPAR